MDDGCLDEGCVDESSFLWRVMIGKSLRGLRVIVTSRPCSALSDLSESGSIHRHVQMSGFSEKNVQEFAVKYLGEREGKEMLSQVAMQPSVASLMHTPFFALLICEQFMEARELPRRRSDVFSSVTLRVAQRFAKRQGLKSSFKRLDKAPTKLFEQVLEVAKVAFDRLKRKDLSYFELDNEDVSSEAVQLGFLEHVQATSSAKADQYGFRHLTVQEYLAALYASPVVLKKVEDVAALAAQLGCGAKAGHLNTFWVFVAALLESDLCEELFCAITETDVQTVRGSVPSSAPVPSMRRRDAQADEGEVTRDTKTRDGQGIVCSHSNDQTQTLLAYRFLLLLHCYNEVVMGGNSKPSACVRYVLGSQGVELRTLYHSPSQADIDVISKMIQTHGKVVKQIDVALHDLDQHGHRHQLVKSLRYCVCLEKLNLGHPYFGLHFAGPELDDFTRNVKYILGKNSKSLKVLDLSHIPIGSSDLCQLTGAMQQCQRLKRLLLAGCGLTSGCARGLAAIVRSLPALIELSLAQNYFTRGGGRDFISSVIPAVQNCKDMQKICLSEVSWLRWYLGPQVTSPLGAMLASLPKLRELELGNTFVSDFGFLHLAPSLQQCSQLKCLKLTDCKLSSSTSMALLVSVLFCLPQLEEFEVDGNEIDDVHVSQLVVGLMECSRLSKLSLSWGVQSNVPTQWLIAVSNLTKRLHNLAELALVGCTIPDRSVGAKLCRAVKDSSSLQTLVLPFGMCPTAVSQLRGLVDDPACRLQTLKARGKDRGKLSSNTSLV